MNPIRFVRLEWKAFFRSASFKTNIAIKILIGFGVIYFALTLLVLGAAVFYLLRDLNMEPFETVNRFMVYYLGTDLVIRYFLQKMPVMNIRPLLTMNLRKNQIVQYTLGKTLLSYFNWVHLFFMLPFSVVLIKEGYGVAPVLTWGVAILLWIAINNALNVLVNNKDVLFYAIASVLIGLGALQYYGVFDIGVWAQPLFMRFYTGAWASVCIALVTLLLYLYAFHYFKRQLYLDAGLKMHGRTADTAQYTWLDRYGTLGTFLKNDIRLIRRNKRSRSTLMLSLMFLFYGLLFMSGSIEAYDSPVWRIFAGIFVTGGFLFTFGQYVPSWDSSYYPLMMSQNIPYRNYLNAKWWLIVIVTAVSTVLGSFYLYFGWEAYAAVLAGAIYNIGVNAHIVLWGGAYIKTPIDLTQNKNVFGDKKAFNIKTLLLSLPKIALPMLVYLVGHLLHSPELGFGLVAALGILGFVFKNKVFTIIEGIYRKEKYKTLAAYSE